MFAINPPPSPQQSRPAKVATANEDWVAIAEAEAVAAANAEHAAAEAAVRDINAAMLAGNASVLESAIAKSPKAVVSRTLTGEHHAVDKRVGPALERLNLLQKFEHAASSPERSMEQLAQFETDRPKHELGALMSTLAAVRQQRAEHDAIGPKQKLPTSLIQLWQELALQQSEPLLPGHIVIDSQHLPLLVERLQRAQACIYAGLHLRCVTARWRPGLS